MADYPAIEITLGSPDDPDLLNWLYARLDDFEPVAGRLPFCPQRVPGPAEERGETVLPGHGQRLLVHEADHEHFRRAGVYDYDGRDQAGQFRKVHKNKKPRQPAGLHVSECTYRTQTTRKPAPSRLMP